MSAGNNSDVIHIRYRNWQGEVAVRTIRPTGRMVFGTSSHHPQPQWLIEVKDVGGDGRVKTFALEGFLGADAAWQQLQQKADAMQVCASNANAEVQACHALFDQVRRLCGHNPGNGSPGIVDAVREVIRERDELRARKDTRGAREEDPGASHQGIVLAASEAVGRQMADLHQEMKRTDRKARRVKLQTAQTIAVLDGMVRERQELLARVAEAEQKARDAERRAGILARERDLALEGERVAALAHEQDRQSLARLLGVLSTLVDASSRKAVPG